MAALAGGPCFRLLKAWGCLSLASCNRKPHRLLFAFAQRTR